MSLGTGVSENSDAFASRRFQREAQTVAEKIEEHCRSAARREVNKFRFASPFGICGDSCGSL